MPGSTAPLFNLHVWHAEGARVHAAPMLPAMR